MIIHRLTIKEFGKIKYFDSVFDSRLAIISDADTDDVIKAVGIVTNNKSLIGCFSKGMISDKTFIGAKAEIGGIVYMINARGFPFGKDFEFDVISPESIRPINFESLFTEIRLCEEEENLTCYRFNKKKPYSDRFLYYTDPDRYYGPGIFRKKTDGAGQTRSFRFYLSDFIKNVYSASFIENICNAEIADYQSFLCLNLFWERFENMRNMHHESLPLIINGFTDIEQANDVSSLKKLAYGRQLLFIKPGFSINNNGL